MAKKKQRGGAREGSGRKPVNPEGVTVVLATSVPGVLVEQLDAVASKNGWNRSETVTRAIRAFLASKQAKG